MTQSKKQSSKYKVVLNTVGKEYIQRAEYIDLALSQMGLDWNDIKGKGTITVSRGGQSYEHLFNTVKLRRIFGSKITRALWAKRLKLLLKEGKKTNKIERLDISSKNIDEAVDDVEKNLKL